MKKHKPKLTLYQPANYQIKVPGILDKDFADWNEGMTVTVEEDRDGLPFTVLTGAFDQAALQGLLRRLYGFGLPIISVLCVDYLGIQQRIK